MGPGRTSRAWYFHSPDLYNRGYELLKGESHRTEHIFIWLISICPINLAEEIKNLKFLLLNTGFLFFLFSGRCPACWNEQPTIRDAREGDLSL